MTFTEYWPDNLRLTPFRFIFFFISLLVGFLMIVIKAFEVEKRTTARRRSRAAVKIADRIEQDERDEREEREEEEHQRRRERRREVR